jgi:inhibitor of cysteine peptidase
MKKLLMLGAMLMLGIFVVAGCAGETKINTYTDPAQTINAGVNQEFVIALDSNPTTGYNWEEKHDAAMLNLVENKYEPDKKAAGLVGAGGTQYFQFKALKTGSTEITLTYKRPWESSVGEQKVFKVDIK